VADPNGNGGLQFTVGYADNEYYNGYVDEVAVGLNGGAATTYDFAPAPEPSTWTMSLLAFGGLVFAARKRATSKS
jgi:hypothetical protein